MELSYFFAKLIGFYLVIVAFGMLVNAKSFQLLIVESSHNKALVVFSGILSLIFGLVVVLTHNVWHGWPVLITLVGYLSVIKGIVRILFTNWCERVMPQFSKREPYYVTAILVLILGLVLLYFGYMW